MFGCIPDLSDPATVGALEGLARELTASPELYLERCGPGEYWIVKGLHADYTDEDGDRVTGDTRAEAWACVILRLPEGSDSSDEG